jgi:hypothetical protein
MSNYGRGHWEKTALHYTPKKHRGLRNVEAVCGRVTMQVVNTLSMVTCKDCLKKTARKSEGRTEECV